MQGFTDDMQARLRTSVLIAAAAADASVGVVSRRIDAGTNAHQLRHKNTYM